MQSGTNNSNRIQWIDCAKGIGIILVIIGHCFTNETPLFVIHSFHMPLFFILSAVTFRTSTNNDEFVRKTEKAFRHLIIPYTIMFCYTVIWKMIHTYADIFSSNSAIKEFFAEYILKFVYASGMPVEVKDTTVSGIGLTWFFVALFVSRTIFDFAHLKIKKQHNFIIFCMAACVLGVSVSRIQQLPFSLDICLAVLPFLLFGQNMLSLMPEKNWGGKFIASGFIWILLWGVTSNRLFNLAGRYYSLFPISYLTAIAGTVMICELCVGFCKLGKLITPLVYIGKNSLYMMCIHVLDYSLLKNMWNISDVLQIRIVMRIFVDLAAFSCFMGIRFVFNKYFAKNK